MKPAALLFFFLLLFTISCQNKPQPITSHKDSVPSKSKTLTVNHPEKFDPYFLEELETSCKASLICITDSMMISQTGDTVFFPLCREYKNLQYSNQQGDSLTLNWVYYNALSVDFTYKNKNGDKSHFQKIARLAPCFFFGSESFSSPEDPMQMIFGTEFSFNAPEEYFRVIVDDENWKYCCVTLRNNNSKTVDLLMKKVK
jgi:hypothetical protein